MKPADMASRLNIDLRSVAVYLCVFLVTFIIMFHNLSLDKLLSAYAALILAFQLPGTFLISLLTKKIGKTELLLGLAPGIAWAGLLTYLLGLLHVDFRISLIISTGAAYVIYLVFLIISRPRYPQEAIEK
jgi:hypothetical protein